MTTNRFLIGKFMQGLIPTEASMPTTSSCSFCKTTGAVADSEGTLMVCPVCQGRKEPWSQLQMKIKKMKIIRVDTVTDANGGAVRLITSHGTFDSRRLFPTKAKAAAHTAAEAYTEGKPWEHYALRPLTRELAAA